MHQLHAGLIRFEDEAADANPATHDGRVNGCVMVLKQLRQMTVISNRLLIDDCMHQQTVGLHTQPR